MIHEHSIAFFEACNCGIMLPFDDVLYMFCKDVVYICLSFGSDSCIKMYMKCLYLKYEFAIYVFSQSSFINLSLNDFLYNLF